MLFGAALVAIGVLAAALADRIRGVRIARDASEALPRERSANGWRSRAVSGPAHAARTSIPVVEHAEYRSTPAPVKPPRAPRPEPKVPSPEGGEDVIAALVAAGYKKAIATEAAWACSSGERATVETWTAAALRRCARGGMS